MTADAVHEIVELDDGRILTEKLDVDLVPGVSVYKKNELSVPTPLAGFIAVSKAP